MWNTLTVDKAFHKSTDGTFSRSVECREGKSVSRLSVSKNKMIEAVQCNQPATRYLNDHPGEWCLIEGPRLVSDASRLDTQLWS